MNEQTKEQEKLESELIALVSERVYDKCMNLEKVSRNDDALIAIAKPAVDSVVKELQDPSKIYWKG